MKSEAMKQLTDLVFGKTVPSESWREYERNLGKDAEYYHIKYVVGVAEANEPATQADWQLSCEATVTGQGPEEKK